MRSATLGGAAGPFGSGPAAPLPTRGPALRSVARVLLVAVGVATVLLLVLPDGLQPWQRLRALWQSPGWLLAAVGGLSCSHLLRAARLHREWQPRTGARYRDCLALFVLHNAAVVWLPLRSGEAGYLLWLRRRWQVPTTEALASLLWLRVQDALVLAALSVTVWLALRQRVEPASALLAGAAAALLLGAAVMGLQHWLRRAGAQAPAVSTAGGLGGRRLWPRLRGALLQSRGGAWAWLLCLANWLVKLLTLAVWLSLAGALSKSAGLLGAVGGEWAAVLPLQGPGGFGSYELGVWAGVQAAAGGSSPAAADVLAAAFGAHLLSLAVATAAALLLGSVVLWRRARELPQPATDV